MFHERLGKLREGTGLSQSELAKRLGMARTTYAGYENGSREPDLKTLEKLADWFGVDLNWLITGTERELDEDDMMLIKKFSKLKDEDQQYILNLIDRLKE